MIDVDKFLASIMKCLCMPHREDAYMCRHWINKALDAQGLKFENGEIVKNQRRVAAEAMESIFESEDERIRNEIIAFVEQSIHRGGGTPIPQEQEDKWIAWLEKQGTTIKKTGHKFSIGDIISNGKVVYRVDGIVKNCIGEDCYFLVDIKKEKDGMRYAILLDAEGNPHNSGEITWLCEQVDMSFQKQLSQSVTKVSDKVWSEEDEEELEIAITVLQRAGQWDSATWLKSLKDRLKGE